MEGLPRMQPRPHYVACSSQCLSDSGDGSLRFWHRVTYAPLPETSLPRLPFLKPIVDGQVIFGLNGPAHVQRNFAGQLRSPSRTIYFGRVFTDIAGTLDLAMPPGAFVGYDGQSDSEAASLLNPFHYIATLVSVHGRCWARCL